MRRELKALDVALEGHMRELIAEQAVALGMSPGQTFSALAIRDAELTAEAAIRGVNEGDPERLISLPHDGLISAGQLVDLWHLAAFLDEGFRDED